ncbi:MAG TPA: YceI family protein [Gemmatimonadaceae bacterium]|nr:YceI family protein [Gemmatimonadaceae bacterium]
MTTAATPTTTGTTTWNVDPAHSLVEFAVKHLMISTVKGRFGDVKGTITHNEAEPAQSKVHIEISTASIDTRAEQRDAHLRSPDFFDVERFPAMKFVSKRVDGDINGEFKLIGDLTIRDQTHEVALAAEFQGRGKDPWGGERMGFEANGKINRKEFGLTWNQALETGGFVVGEDIKLSIHVELVKAA